MASSQIAFMHNIKNNFSLAKIDKSWTLFLDRDGVINYEKKLDYIHKWSEFKFYEDAIEAIAILNKHFNKVIIVTNQKGVGKGLTKEEDLREIHANLAKAVENAGGKIDAFYYCTALSNDDICRKPNPGMGIQAAKDFSDIDLQKAVMVGNNISDMEFARNLGVHSVFLQTTNPDLALPDARIDLHYPTLWHFAQALDKL